MKNIRKHLWSILRMLAPCSIGFALLCVGGYLVLQKLQYTDTGGLVMGCILMSCGFLAIFTSVTWNICQRVKRKVDQRRRRRQQNVQVYTVERRPSSFPPSYEESQRCHQDLETDPEYVVLDGVPVVLNLAPPVYCQNGAQSPDFMGSWEQPPVYEDSSSATCG